MFQVVARNFSILTAEQIASGAIIFLFIAFTARQLGPAQFGTFVLIGAYVRLVALTVSAGVGPIAFRELARHRNDALELFNDILSMRLALGVAGYVGLIAVARLIGEDREVLGLLAIAAVTLILDPFNDSYAAYYTAHERVGIPSTVGVSSMALSAVVGIVVLLSGFGLAVLIVSEAVTSVLVTVVWTFVFRSRMLRFTLRARFAEWKRLLMLIAPFVPVQFCNQLNRVLNVVLLGRLSGPIPTEESVGYYGPASSTTNTAVVLVMSLRRALIPPVTARLTEGHSVTYELDLASKMVLAFFALPLLLGTSFMAPQVISLLFGEHYAPSAAALVILGWAGALQIAATVLEAFLFSYPTHRVQDYIMGAFIPVLVNALLCVLLIEQYGFVGAAAGAVAGRLVYLIYLAHYCRQRLGSEALRLQQYADSALLLLSALGVWYLTFAAIANAWVACVVAVIFTLPLIAGFVLYVRRQSARRAES
jgi:O-antigen/teichoic acid export membrane protein